MNTFHFHRELNVAYLQDRFGADPFVAREVLGSFVELAEEQMSMMDQARKLHKLPVMARIAMRLDEGLDMTGLHEEKKKLQDFRSSVALKETDDELLSFATEVMDILHHKTNLLRVEVHRLDRHIESAAQGRY